MAHQWMRCNLATATFPFQTSLGDRTIVVSRYDQNFDYLSSIGEPIKDRGLPRAMYMHNCIPTAQGYQAVGYDEEVVSSSPGTDLLFDTVFALDYDIDDVSYRIFLSPAQGQNFILDGTIGNWTSFQPQPPDTIAADTLITRSNVNGNSYFFYQNIGCYKYIPNNVTDATTMLVGPQIIPITFLGLTATGIKGICSANGYHIAFDDVSIVWSSTINELDFTPSLTTGAGGGTPQFCNGKIQFCVPISGGFLIYCEKNVVSATYSGNIRFPWIYAEVAGSGGCDSLAKVSWKSNFATHYAWTSGGLQELTRTSARDVYPDATDFLANLSFEDFDTTTLEFSESFLTTPLSIRVNLVGDRYVVISYGVTYPNYTHALVMDTALLRWGKLRVNHRECFEWAPPNLYGPVTYGMLTNLTYGNLVNITYGDFNLGISTPDTPKKNIGFLQQDGTVLVVNFDLAQTTVSDAALFLGKFQFDRNKRIVGQQYDVESVINGNSFGFYLFPTNDGKTFLPPVTPYLFTNAPLSKRYKARLDGFNISMGFIGAFNLTSFMWDFTLGGDR